MGFTPFRRLSIIRPPSVSAPQTKSVYKRVYHKEKSAKYINVCADTAGGRQRYRDRLVGNAQLLEMLCGNANAVGVSKQRLAGCAAVGGTVTEYKSMPGMIGLVTCGETGLFDIIQLVFTQDDTLFQIGFEEDVTIFTGSGRSNQTSGGIIKTKDGSCQRLMVLAAKLLTR